MADNVEVKIVGDTGDATSRVEAANVSIAASLAGISKALEKMAARSGATRQSVKHDTDLMSQFFAAFHENVRFRFGSVNSIIQTFSTKLAAVGTILAGGALFAKSVSEMLKLENEVRGLTITFGLTTDKATTMAIGLKLAGIEAGTFEAMAFKVGRTLRSQADEFDRLRVSVKDANGDFLPMDQILQNIFKRMQDFKAGTDQNEFALSTVGRSAVDFASDMLRLNAVTERATQLQHDFNIEMGPERIAKIEAYRIELGAFHVILGDVGDKIGEAVLPRLMRLAEYFNSIGPSAIKTFIDALTRVLAGLDVLQNGFQELYLQVSNAWNNVVISTTAMVRSFKVLMTEGWTAAVKIVADANAEILRNQLETNAAILGLEAALTLRLAKLGAEREAPKVAGAGPMPSGTERFRVKPSGADERLAAWKDELLKLQEAEGYFHEFSKAQEADFWDAKLALVRGKGKEDVKLRQELDHLIFNARKSAAHEELAVQLAAMETEAAAYRHNIEAKIAIAEREAALIASKYGNESKEAETAYKKIIVLRQQLADQILKLDEIQLKTEEAHYAHAIEIAKLAGDQQLALGQINNAQRLAMEAAFENQMFAKMLAGYQGFKARALAEGDVVLAAQTNEKIEALQDAHQAAMTKLANAGVLEREKYALEANKVIESSFSTLLSDLAAHTKSVKQAFLDFFKSITDGLSKIAANQVASQVLGAGSAGGGFLSGITSKIFGGGVLGGAGAAGPEAAHTAAVTADTTAITLATTTSTALNTASLTLTAAFTALVASAEAASAAMAAMGASGGAGGGLGGLFNASGGLGGLFGIPGAALGTPYVPQDSLAYVHKGEAIIPAKYNQGGASSSGLMQTNHFQFVISGPIDTRTQDQIMAAAATGARRATIRTG